MLTVTVIYFFLPKPKKSKYLFLAQHFTRWILEITNKACCFPYLDSKKFLGHVTRHTVEEQGHDGEQEQGQDNFDHKPLVLIADKIADCF